MGADEAKTAVTEDGKKIGTPSKRRKMGINMKKTGIISIILVLISLLCGCNKTVAQPTETAQLPQLTEQTEAQSQAQTETPFPEGFTAEAEDDYVRYSGGGISILLENSFYPTTATDGYVIYDNGFLTVILSATDEYDTQMLSSTGYELADMTEEEFASILVDANELDPSCMFYDHFDNVCLSYSGQDSNSNEYMSYSVVKKDEATNTFWLIQFIGPLAVYEPYSIYFPEWAASITFS